MIKETATLIDYLHEHQNRFCDEITGNPQKGLIRVEKGEDFYYVDENNITYLFRFNGLSMYSVIDELKKTGVNKHFFKGMQYFKCDPPITIIFSIHNYVFGFHVDIYVTEVNIAQALRGIATLENLIVLNDFFKSSWFNSEPKVSIPKVIDKINEFMRNV